MLPLEEILEKLKDKDNDDKRIEIIKVDPARREFLDNITGRIVDLLKEECKDPGEAYMVIQLILLSFQNTYGIESGYFIKGSDLGDG